MKIQSMQKVIDFTRAYGQWVLIFFHTIGLFLLGSSWRHDLVFLTPYNLLLLLGVFLLASDRPARLGMYMLPIVLGFIIEVIGTNTGWPFGAYTYGTALGPRLLQTPLMIGVLWWVLIRAWYDVAGRWTGSPWVRSFITGTAMVSMDLLIEPVAIELGFWAWEGAAVPLSNYIAWFVLATVFARLTASGDTKNPISPWVIGVLGVFFAVLCVMYA
jgi:putative membrane protein